ncbi:MAG: DUF2281 domain-containing protein [bacterium]
MPTLPTTYSVANANGEIVIRPNRSAFDSERVVAILNLLKLKTGKEKAKRSKQKRATHANTLEHLVGKLPADLKKEVHDFAQFLVEKRTGRKQQKLRLSWAGKLNEFQDKFSAIELQKKALEWWGE